MKELEHLQAVRPKGYPVRHRRKVPFDPDIAVPEGFRERYIKICRNDQELDRFILSADDYAELLIDAYSTNVHRTTSLEGNPLDEREVRRITRGTFAGDRVLDDRSGPVKEIINHLRIPALEEAFRFPWDHATIRSLHHVLLQGTDDVDAGKYRTSGAVVMTDEGQELFIPCPPEHIEGEMSSLLDWINGKGMAFNPLVEATVAFHEFESIHPFMDGNGRVGRSLFNLFLKNSGLGNINKCKIEDHILGDQELYYQLLAQADETGSYTSLIDMFSIAILRSYEDAMADFGERDLLSRRMDENSKTLLIRAKRIGREFTIKEASGWVDGISYQSVRNRLNGLVEMGALRKIGERRGLKFLFNDPMETFLRNVEGE